MGFLFDILRLSAGSVAWGVLIALVMMALFVFIVRGWWKDAIFTPSTYILGAVLAVLLMVQCTLIVGALKIINTADTYQPVVEGFVNQYFTAGEIVTKEKADEVLGDFISEYPLVQHYIESGEFYGMQAAELATSIMEELRSYMRSYILRRVLWCLGFVVVLGGIAIKTLENPVRGSRRRSVSPVPGRDRLTVGNRATTRVSTRHGRRR